MAYIGRDTDKLSNIEVLDAITFDGSSSYTLQKNSVNFTPSSANNVLVSIDGVVQANNFTVSGSTIDFGVAVPSTSTCDWIYHIGVGLITTPADGTVTNSKIASSIITGQTEDTTPADDDLILVYDTSATALKKVQKSNFAGGGITMADQWRLTANITGTNADITSNLEQIDTYSPGLIGSAMSVSSGIFTFPETGIYLIMANCRISVESGGDVSVDVLLNVTTDNSTYNTLNMMQHGDGGGYTAGASMMSLFDVQDTTTHKCKFTTSSFDAGTILQGSTNDSKTSFTFIRLGDT